MPRAVSSSRELMPWLSSPTRDLANRGQPGIIPQSQRELETEWTELEDDASRHSVQQTRSSRHPAGRRNRSHGGEGREPVYKAIATQGTGVVETFLGLIEITWERLDAWHDLAGKFKVKGEMLLDNLKRQLLSKES